MFIFSALTSTVTLQAYFVNRQSSLANLNAAEIKPGDTIERDGKRFILMPKLRWSE